MSTPTVFFIITLVAMAMSSIILILSTKREALSLIAMLLFATAGIGAYAGNIESLGKPKPSSLEFARSDAPEAVVLSARVVPKKTIYLWLHFRGYPEPVAYSYPWTAEEMAKDLRQAMTGNEKQRIIMRDPLRPKGQGPRRSRCFIQSQSPKRKRRIQRKRPQPIATPTGTSDEFTARLSL